MAAGLQILGKDKHFLRAKIRDFHNGGHRWQTVALALVQDKTCHPLHPRYRHIDADGKIRPEWDGGDISPSCSYYADLMKHLKFRRGAE